MSAVRPSPPPKGALKPSLWEGDPGAGGGVPSGVRPSGVRDLGAAAEPASASEAAVCAQGPWAPERFPSCGCSAKETTGRRH